MSVKEAVRQQQARLVELLSRPLVNAGRPPGGWLRLMRTALGMSGEEVAKRAGVTRSAIYQAERSELERGITLKQMEKLAEALGGRFVYGIVLDGGLDDVIRAQARRKAEARIRRASAHMALEAQSLSEEQIRRKIDDLAAQLVRDRPPDFWETR